MRCACACGACDRGTAPPGATPRRARRPPRPRGHRSAERQVREPARLRRHPRCWRKTAKIRDDRSGRRVHGGSRSGNHPELIKASPPASRPPAATSVHRRLLHRVNGEPDRATQPRATQPDWTNAAIATPQDLARVVGRRPARGIRSTPTTRPKHVLPVRRAFAGSDTYASLSRGPGCRARVLRSATRRCRTRGVRAYSPRDGQAGIDGAAARQPILRWKQDRQGAPSMVGHPGTCHKATSVGRRYPSRSRRRELIGRPTSSGGLASQEQIVVWQRRRGSCRLVADSRWVWKDFLDCHAINMSNLCPRPTRPNSFLRTTAGHAEGHETLEAPMRDPPPPGTGRCGRPVVRKQHLRPPKAR